MNKKLISFLTTIGWQSLLTIGVAYCIIQMVTIFGGFGIGAISQPQPGDYLNAPSHSKLHRVIAVDVAAMDMSLIVDSNNRVGISSSTPTAYLSLYATGNTPYLNIASTTATAFYVGNDGHVGIGTSTTSYQLDVRGSGTFNPFNVASSTGTSLLTVNTSGNVGLGTTTPSAILTVQGIASTTDLFRIASSTRATLLNVDTGGRLGIGSSTPQSLVSIARDSSTIPFLSIASSSATALYVGSNGNVGIGTSSPANMLDVGIGGNISTNPTLGAELMPSMLRTNWTIGASWDSTNDTDTALNKNAAGSGTITPSAATAIVVGTTYKVVITVSEISGAGGATYTLGGKTGTSINATTTYIDYITAATTGNLIITPVSSGTRFKISSVSVKTLTNSTGDMIVGGRLNLSAPIRAVGGSDAIAVLQNGYVGFGTLVPKNIIDIETPASGSGSLGFSLGAGGNSYIKMFRLESTVPQIELYTGTTKTIQINSNYDSYFNQAAGNFGIGTTTPSAKFTIQGQASTTDLMKIASSTRTTLMTIDNGGFLRLFNHAIVQNDLNIGWNPKLPASKYPAWTSWNNGDVLAFSDVAVEANEERVTFSVHLPHTYQEGSTLQPHIHWALEDTTNCNAVFKVTCSWGNNGEAFGTFTASSTCASGGRTNGAEYCDLGDFTGTGKLVSSVLLCTLQRNSFLLSDTCNGKNAYVELFDFHQMVDSMGSRNETTK